METEIHTACPLCGEKVIKVIETDKEYTSDVKCYNEYYQHRGDKLIKFKHPKHNYHESR